jgi:hypothetical protein
MLIRNRLKKAKHFQQSYRPKKVCNSEFFKFLFTDLKLAKIVRLYNTQMQQGKYKTFEVIK